MAFDLQSLLFRFLQLYRLDRAGLEHLLLVEADDLEKKDPGAFSWDRTAAESLESKTLINSKLLEERVGHFVSLFPDVPETGPRSDEFYRFVFREWDLDRMAELIGSDLRGEAFENWYIQDIRERDELERERKRSEPRDPDLAAYFAWDFAMKMPQVVSRMQLLEDFEYRDIVSEHLRVLFQEAHRCYLGGLDLSVAVVCGAILEQALRETLKVDWKLDLMLKESEDRGILSPEEWGMGDTIREARNYAVHDLPRFMRREIDKAAILVSTRTVVKRLLTAKSGLADHEGLQQ